MTAAKQPNVTTPPPLPKRKSMLAVSEDTDADSRPFGKFTLLASLGAGGMGDVSLAVTESSMGVKKLVVVKRLLIEHATDPGAREMFVDEGRLSVRLNHPNVVQTYEVGVERDNFFIAMEYLEGQPLSRVFTRVAATQTEVPHVVWAQVIARALRGLHYAHELTDYDGAPLNIVHRDLSPQNLFVTYDGVVKIVDFGIAKSEGQESRTQLGMIKGKVAYMAPEQVDPTNDLDRRADIFVLGIVLWELVTGQRLMKGNTVLETFKRIAVSPSPRASTVVDVDPLLDAIIARALEKRAEDRFQTALEMREALEEYIEAAGGAWADDRLGRMVSELFDDQRTQVRQRIRDFMTAPVSTVDPEHLPQLAMSDFSEARPPESSPRASKPSTSTLEVAVPRRLNRKHVALACAGFVASMAMGALLSRSPAPSPPATSPVAEKTTTRVVDSAEAAPATPATAVAAPVTEPGRTEAAPDAKGRSETRRTHSWRAPVPSAAIAPPTTSGQASAPAPAAPAAQAAPVTDGRTQEAAPAATATAHARKFRRTF